MSEIRNVFRPEFLNRVDEIIVFTELSHDELRNIIDLMIEEVAEEAGSKHITLQVSDQVKEHILEVGYSNKYGARPLRRTIQKLIEDEISESYLKGHIQEGAVISFVLDGDKVLLIQGDSHQ
jgi:ATP-dependent Clp protease ATP-binding subunit ClpE